MKTKLLFFSLVVLATGGSLFAQRPISIVGGVVTANVADTNDFQVILSTNVTGVTLVSTTGTSNNAVTPSTGYQVTMRFVQDATGSRTVVFGGNITTSCTVNATALSVTICRWQYTASGNTWADSGSGSGSTAAGWHRLGTVISSSLSVDQNNAAENRTIVDTNCPLEPNLLAGETCFRTWATTGWASGGVAYWEAPTSDAFAVVRSATITPASHAHISVTKCGSTYYLTGANALGTSTAIDLYSSATGNQDWALLQANVVTLGTGGQFDSINFGNSHLICQGAFDQTSNVYLYYEGQDGTKWSMGLATCSSNCFGGSATWTKSPSNPLISTSQTMGGCEFRIFSGTIVARCHGEITGTGSLPSDLWKFTAPTPTGPFTTSETVPDLQRATFDEGMTTTLGQLNKPSTLDVNGACYMFYSATADGSVQSGSFHIKLAVANTTCAAMALTNGGSVEPDRFTGREWDAVNSAYPPPAQGLQVGYGKTTFAPGPHLFLQNILSTSNASISLVGTNSWISDLVTGIPLQIKTTWGAATWQFNAAATNPSTSAQLYLLTIAGVKKPIIVTFFDANTNAGLHIDAPYWLTDTASNTDLTGELSLSAATTASYTFTGVYVSHPECHATPQFDLGATPPRMWITYTSTTSFTVNFSAAVTGSVSYACMGRN